MMNLSLLLLVCLFPIYEAEESLCHIDHTRKIVLAKIDQLLTDIDQPEWQYISKRRGGTDVTLVIEFKGITELIDSAEARIHPESQNSVRSVWAWAVIQSESKNIKGFYIKFRRLLETPDPQIYSNSWSEFAQAVLNDSPTTNAMPDYLNALQALISDKLDDHDNLFDLMSQEVKSNLCNLEQSQQQLLYNIYSIIQITQLKAYSMIQFSWMLLKLYNKGNFTLESEMMATKYRERVAQQADEIIRSMVGAKTEMWRCDPKNHIYNETYTELVKLLQGFIVNEVDLNDQMSCKEDCGFYQKTKQYSCYKNNFCSKQPTCRGDIVGCGFVDSDMWICPAGKMSSRRYDYIEYENGRLLGEKKTCSRPVTKVDSWWRWLFWHCSYCFCLCDDPFNSSTERYFNLRPIISDVQNNKVITGLRFVKINRVTYMQIQEGEMLPKGAINETTIAWKRLQTYDVKSYKVHENIDYLKMTWEQRAIDLDDLKTPPNHVLTGIRFRKVGRHLNFEIQGSEFDFETGKLLRSGEKNQWISNDNTDGAPSEPRKKLQLGSPGVPTKSPSASIPDSENDMYLEFVATDFGMDAAQTTVPFIDTQPVSPKPPMPLAGAGIYHKGYPGYGGFVAPKVYTLDLTPHLQNQFPEINEAWRRIQSK